jgi:PAS domain S-box-containing protein
MPTPNIKPDIKTDVAIVSGQVAFANGDAAGTSVRRTLYVLLIEDNENDAALLERHLRRNGFDARVTRVETAKSLRGALAEMAARRDAQRIVIADYNLPTFSGPEALRMLRDSGLDLPFIMMSGAVSEEAAVESMRAGAQDYVTKQNLTRLVPAIERELKEAEERRERAAAEAALRASQARFHRLVEAMPLGLLIGEASGRIVYANGAVERMLGYRAAVVSAGASGSLRFDSISPGLEATIATAELDGSGTTPPFEAVCVTADGASVEVLIGIALLNPEDPAGQRQIAAFIADLTLQKKSEEMLRRTEKLAVAGRLAASIAHEINNPLEAITNCLYLLGRGELCAEARQYLEMAQRELDLVAKITMQTLRFYRSSGRAQLTDVRELIGSVLDLLDRRLRQQEIEVRCEFGETPRVVAHDGEIRQVLANLVSNAIDALPGGGDLLVRTAAASDWSSGAAGVRITIADNGTGMDDATRGRIFDAFFSTKGITGTGLGLWISREIIQKHGGHLRVRSRRRTEGAPGGTVFALFLPLGITD